VLPAFYTQAGWVRVRLTERLPLDLGFKYRLLETNDGYTRVAQLREDMAHTHLV
jgi:hypothetical protein